VTGRDVYVAAVLEGCLDLGALAVSHDYHRKRSPKKLRGSGPRCPYITWSPTFVLVGPFLVR
jgi:hypothetical protein